MKSIEIKTAQNVRLEYELASLRERILAFLLDLLAMGLATLVLSLIFNGILGVTGTLEIVTSIITGSVILFYSLALEYFNNGQSVGKKLMKIQVIKITGDKATFYDYFGRWIFRMLDIYFSFGAIASILIASSSRAQRIGDIVSNTSVIKLESSVYLSLNDILKIQSRETYQPVYAQAKHLAEDDVILIKSTIDRFKKYNNHAHAEAVDQLTDRIKSVLEIRDSIPDNVKFLQTVINDYIVLTR
ncbi:MAG TPA: RDD family protein [Cyclobacteriaceae bacterium]|nr:RDD family protein [Cyclobacteriaceae bacterium]HMV11033.1 RDD family protein [Cyclobacteriaceae bacterium]HMV88632.1 RDD family protein [Cyclobacteriaceae bacterium]HMX00606.1 RDD family protein [Cyclobacteriaceae bacterium]HMX49519.1 RDD family protein [Cyclobacteriaceae bacterium]